MPDAAGSNFKTAEVDYNNPDSLATARKGQDTVICALDASAFPQQKALLGASVHAGMARFFPSEFGNDALNLNAAKLPLFATSKALGSIKRPSSAPICTSLEALAPVGSIR